MEPDSLVSQAYDLLVSDAGLAQIVAFTRAHDPTGELRARWGDRFDARMSYLLEKARDMFYIGKEFPGSKEEILLCMAHCVASAPYLGTSDAQVHAYLRNLLRELVSEG